jgi:hypothetical protein
MKMYGICILHMIRRCLPHSPLLIIQGDLLDPTWLTWLQHPYLSCQLLLCGKPHRDTQSHEVLQQVARGLVMGTFDWLAMAQP